MQALAEWAAEANARALVAPVGSTRQRALGALGVPTVVVQEGGYDLASIGALVEEFLIGIEEGLSG